jgi:hypothetical protein
MAKQKYRLGAGARCSVLYSKLCPGNYVAQHSPNMTRQEWLEGLVATRQEVVTRKGKRVRFTFFTHPGHPGQEFYSNFLKVTAKGDADQNTCIEDRRRAIFWRFDQEGGTGRRLCLDLRWTIGLPQRLWVRLKLFKDLMLLLTLGVDLMAG